MECCGKLCYSTRSQANRAKGFMRNEKRSHLGMMVYRCPSGNGWHLSQRMEQAQNRRFKISRALDRQDLRFAEAGE